MQRKDFRSEKRLTKSPMVGSVYNMLLWLSGSSFVGRISAYFSVLNFSSDEKDFYYPCLPSDNILHKIISGNKKSNLFTWDDPFAGKIKWNLRYFTVRTIIQLYQEYIVWKYCLAAWNESLTDVPGELVFPVLSGPDKINKWTQTVSHLATRFERNWWKIKIRISDRIIGNHISVFIETYVFSDSCGLLWLKTGRCNFSL